MASSTVASAFLADLYGDAKGAVEVRCFYDRLPDGEPKKFVARHWPKTPPVLDDVVASYDRAKRVGVYFGVAKRKTGTKTGFKTDLRTATAVWCDLDTAKLGLDKAAIAIRVHQLPVELQPSACIDSGGGLHLYWFLARPVDLTHETGVDRLEHVNMLLSDKLGGDPACFNADRILRLPGSYNGKRSKPEKVEVLWSYRWHRHHLAVLEDAWTEAPDMTWPSAQGVVTGEPDHPRTMAEKLDALARMTRKARTVSREELWDCARHKGMEHGRPVVGPYISLHEAMTRAVAGYHCDGMSDADAIATTLHQATIVRRKSGTLEQWDAPAEHEVLVKSLERWKQKFTLLRAQDKQRKRAETAAKKAGAKHDV